MPLLQNLPGKSPSVNIKSKNTIKPLSDLEFDIKPPKRKPYRCTFLYSDTLENWIITASDPTDSYTLNDVRNNEIVLALLLTTGLDVNTATIKINLTQNKLIKYSQQLQESLYYPLIVHFDRYCDYDAAQTGDRESMVKLCKVIRAWGKFKSKLVAMSATMPIMDLVGEMDQKLAVILKNDKLTFYDIY